MTSKWTTNPMPGTGTVSTAAPLAEQYVVALLRGKNSFGDMIYSSVKIFFPNIQAFKAALNAGQGFNPSDFGEVLAAGQGEPTAEMHAEMVAKYPLIDNNSSSGSGAQSIPDEKKAWDEY